MMSKGLGAEKCFISSRKTNTYLKAKYYLRSISDRRQNGLRMSFVGKRDGCGNYIMIYTLLLSKIHSNILMAF